MFTVEGDRIKILSVQQTIDPANTPGEVIVPTMRVSDGSGTLPDTPNYLNYKYSNLQVTVNRPFIPISWSFNIAGRFGALIQPYNLVSFTTPYIVSVNYPNLTSPIFRIDPTYIKYAPLIASAGVQSNNYQFVPISATNQWYFNGSIYIQNLSDIKFSSQDFMPVNDYILHPLDTIEKYLYPFYSEQTTQDQYTGGIVNYAPSGASKIIRSTFMYLSL